MGSASAIHIVPAILYDASFAVIVGVFLAERWLRGISTVPDDSAGAACAALAIRLRRVISVALAILLLCHILRPWLAASSMSGSTAFEEVLALVPTVLSSTRQGWLWYASSIALIALIAAHWFLARREGAPFQWVEIAALLILAAIKAGASHASEEGDFTVAEIAQWLHLLATAVWAGAIIISGFLAVPKLDLVRVEALWAYGNQLSRTVTWALIVLLVAGLYLSWHDMHGVLRMLWTGSWGRVLLAKSAFVTTAAALGSATRFYCVKRPATSDRAGMMTRFLRCEAGAMIVILCLSGLLANTNPGG